MRGNSWRWLVLIAILACSGKKRPFADAPPDDWMGVDSLQPSGAAPPGGSDVTAGAGESSPVDAPLVPLPPTNELPPGSPGAPCAISADCNAPGQCVDGVCCSSACNDLCAACDVPGSLGTCSAAPIDDVCGTLTCAGFDTECRKLDTSQVALNCESFGICKAQADCAILNEPSGTPCQSGTGSCDDAGACVVAGKASLGQTCAVDTDCAEGHCVTGEGGALICCDAACDGPCQGCGAAGHCEVTPATDSRCEAVACPADDVCRDYTADITASQCRGFGQCQTALDCERVALRPDAECECDAASGACRLRVGAACADAAECSSGVCTANALGLNLCCTNACAAGLFCSSDGNACVACEGNAIECDGNNQRTCNGGSMATTPCPNGCTLGIGCNALPPLGFPCPAGQCAVPNVCQTDTTGAARCCSRDCAAEGKVCAENGSCVCRPGEVAAGNTCLLQDGDPCQTSQQCQVGSTCTDGVCCQEACNGSCERCEPNTGLCVALGAGQQDNQCANGRQCNGARGDCRLTVRQPCSGNGAECTTNACEPTVGNTTQICCSQACSGNRPFCRSNGQGCVQCETNADCGNGCNTQTGLCNDLLPIGTQCGTTSQCGSGAQCLLDQSGQTRCCERNCAAEGLLCNGAGRCVAPAPAALATIGGVPPAFPRTLVDSTSTTTRLWTIQNNGGRVTAALQLQGNAEFPTSGNCLNLVLQPGGSCSLTISFAPRSAGTRAATLTVTGGQGVAVSVGVQGEARLRDGAPCTPNGVALCDSNRCTEWLPDLDGDGFGSTVAVGGQASVFVCGDGSSQNRPPPLQTFEGNLPCFGGGEREWQYAPSRPVNDCCDHPCPGVALDTISSALAFPGATVGGTEAANCAPGVFTLDFNCDGTPVIVDPVGPSQPPCNSAPNAISAAQCSARSGLVMPLTCGQSGVRQSCGLTNGVCGPIAAATPVPTTCL